MRAIIDVLARPGMARLFLAQFLIYGQLFLAFSTLPLYTEQLGGNAWTIGLHTAIFTGVALLLRFFLGPLADSHGRKLPLLLGAFIYASTNGLLLLADNLVLLGLVRAYQGIGLAAYPSAAAAMVLDLAPPESRGVAIGLNRAVHALALLLFPFGAELLLGRWGYQALFLLGGALTMVAFGLLLSLPGAAPGQVALFSPAQALGSFAAVGRRPAVLAILAAVGVSAITYMGATTFLPLWVQTEGGGNYGPFFLALGTGAFVAGFAGGVVDRYGPRNALIAGLTIMAAGAGLLAGRSGDLTLLLSGGLLGVGFTVGMSAAPNWIDRIVPQHQRATALALAETGIDTGISLGFPLLGLLAASLGYGSVFVTMAFMILAVALVVARQGRGPAPRTEPPAPSPQHHSP